MKILVMITILMGSFYLARQLTGDVALCIMYIAGILNATIQSN